MAEVEWNEDAGNLEVALHIWPNDLEKALRDRFQDQVSLEETHEVDAMIEKYLAERITITEASGKRAELKWLGKEVTLKSCWLYFEVPLEEKPDGLVFEHRLLLDLLPDQTNLIHFKHGRKRTTLRFSADQSKRTLNFADLRFDISAR